MGRLMIINGSPRAPRSNSKQYAEILKGYWSDQIIEYNVTEKKHAQLCKKLEFCSDLLFVFPLYADSLPVTLMYFLKEMENHALSKKPTIHILINCGFFEPEQNLLACKMIQLFCKQNGYPFGSTLCIGSGEAILDTPFSFLVKRKIKKLADSILIQQPTKLRVTMPLPKKVFVNASTKYWIEYGVRNQISKQQMETMKIE